MAQTTDPVERVEQGALLSRSRRGSATLGIRAFLGVVFTVFAAAFAAVTLLPHDPYTRYQSFEGTIFGRLDWIYDRIAHDPTPIDVLILASSRTARGANVDRMTEEFAARGMTVHVANAAIPASGMDWRLTVLRDALEHHPEIKLVVWELVEAFPRDGHQVFADLATPGEILSSPWLVNRNLPANLARLPYRQLEYFLASRMPAAFGHRAAFDPDTYPGPTPDHRMFNDPDWAEREARIDLTGPAHARALAAESRHRREEITWPVLPDALAGAEYGVSRHYIRAAAELGDTHGFDLAFVFLPFYDGYDDALEADWVSEFGPYWAASFLKVNPANYVDAAHASQIGVNRISPWLAGQIADHLQHTD